MSCALCGELCLLCVVCCGVSCTLLCLCLVRFGALCGDFCTVYNGVVSRFLHGSVAFLELDLRTCPAFFSSSRSLNLPFTDMCCVCVCVCVCVRVCVCVCTVR